MDGEIKGSWRFCPPGASRTGTRMGSYKLEGQKWNLDTATASQYKSSPCGYMGKGIFCTWNVHRNCRAGAVRRTRGTRSRGLHRGWHAQVGSYIFAVRYLDCSVENKEVLFNMKLGTMKQIIRKGAAASQQKARLASLQPILSRTQKKRRD
jgi:hypothetical protein